MAELLIMSRDTNDQIWGTVPPLAAGVVFSEAVIVDVAVSADEYYRVRAWVEGYGTDLAEIMLDEANAQKLHAALGEALKLGTWAV